MARTALDRAERLFAAGRHAEIIPLLEPQVPVYRESPRFYFLLGSACLRAGDAGGAYTYLKRAEQLAPKNADTTLALAALHVRRGETDKAVEAYLSVLEERPDDRLAKRALAVLRKEGAPERLAAFVESGQITRLYPGPRRLPPLILPAAAVVVACAAIWLLWPTASGLVRTLTASHAPRPEVAAVNLSAPERAAPVTTGGSFRYVLTEVQALDTFEKAKAYFQQYRDNAALVEINRLIGSNASPAVKDKARALKGFVGAPDFRTARDVPSFAEVAQDPELYDGCVVVWRGMAANLRAAEGAIDFDFLVGYDEKKSLQGIIPVHMTGVSVPLDRPLEVLAVIRAGERGPELQGSAIHELLGS